MVELMLTVDNLRNKMEIWLSHPTIGKPVLEGQGTFQQLLYPSECRERGISYKAKMQIKVNYRVNGVTSSEVRTFGSVPIMVNVGEF
jgi:DNA-directed RNA polymerase I subunit RPA2